MWNANFQVIRENCFRSVIMCQENLAPPPGIFRNLWCHKANRSRIKHMQKFARKPMAHSELLLNYFKAIKEFPSDISTCAPIVCSIRL